MGAPVARKSASKIRSSEVVTRIISICAFVSILAAEALGRSAPPPMAATRSYERWLAPPHLSALERQVLSAAQRWTSGPGAREGEALSYDARLHAAAQRLLGIVPNDAGAAFPLEQARLAA